MLHVQPTTHWTSSFSSNPSPSYSFNKRNVTSPRTKLQGPEADDFRASVSTIQWENVLDYRNRKILKMFAIRYKSSIVILRSWLSPSQKKNSSLSGWKLNWRRKEYTDKTCQAYRQSLLCISGPTTRKNWDNLQSVWDTVKLLACLLAGCLVQWFNVWMTEWTTACFLRCLTGWFAC